MSCINFIRNEYVFTLINKAFVIILGLLQSVLIARFLGAELQGVSAYISSIVSIGCIVVTFGIHQAYAYYRRIFNTKMLTNSFLTIVTCIYAFLALLAIPFYYFSIHDYLTFYIWVSVVIIGYSNVIQYVTLIEEPNKKNASYTIASVLYLIYNLLLFLFTSSSFELMISLILFRDFVCIFFCIYILDIHLSFSRFTASLAPKLFSFGFFPMISLLLTTLNYRLDVLMLKDSPNVLLSSIGIYSIGIALSEKIALIPDTLMGILVSRLSRGSSVHEVAKVCRLSFLASSILCILLLLLGEKAILFLYGNQYDGAYSIIVISALGSVFIGFFKLIAQYNIIKGKQKRNMIMLVFSVLVNLILNYVFIPLWDVKGAAFSTCISHIICGALFIILLNRKANIKITEIIFIQRSDLKFLHKNNL